jgi:hypothetical protein
MPASAMHARNAGSRPNPRARNDSDSARIGSDGARRKWDGIVSAIAD